MKITTESGATYRITENHICYKIDHHGYHYSPFKIWTMKPIDGNNLPSSWDDLHALPLGDPVIGMRLFVAGRDIWWISTNVTKIEDDEDA